MTSLTFVLAPDSFKESMTAVQACQAMQRGIHQVLPNAQCIHAPMADGGEGTVDALIAALNGTRIPCQVMGPLATQQISTYFGLVDAGQTAVIEMAKANGIDLLAPEQRNPLFTTTYGTGQMIHQALDLGVTKIIVGLGGSVTNDGGAGSNACEWECIAGYKPGENSLEKNWKKGWFSAGCCYLPVVWPAFCIRLR